MVVMMMCLNGGDNYWSTTWLLSAVGDLDHWSGAGWTRLVLLVITILLVSYRFYLYYRSRPTTTAPAPAAIGRGGGGSAADATSWISRFFHSSPPSVRGESLVNNNNNTTDAGGMADDDDDIQLIDDQDNNSGDGSPLEDADSSEDVSLPDWAIKARSECRQRRTPRMDPSMAMMDPGGRLKRGAGETPATCPFSAAAAAKDSGRGSFGEEGASGGAGASDLPDLCPFMGGGGEGGMFGGPPQSKEEKASLGQNLVNKWDEFKQSEKFVKVKSIPGPASIAYKKLDDPKQDLSDVHSQQELKKIPPIVKVSNPSTDECEISELTMEDLGANVDIGHLPAEIKKARLRQAQNVITDKMTDEEWREEARIRQEQMAAICQVIKDQDGFGVSAQELEDQMKLYSL